MQFLGLLASIPNVAAHVRHLPVTVSQELQFEPQLRQLPAPSLYFPAGQTVRLTQVVPFNKPTDKKKPVAHLLHAPVSAVQEMQLAEQAAH